MAYALTPASFDQFVVGTMIEWLGIGILPTSAYNAAGHLPVAIALPEGPSWTAFFFSGAAALTSNGLSAATPLTATAADPSTALCFLYSAIVYYNR